MNDTFIKDKADAWDSVVDALNFAQPGWHDLAPRGVDAAVTAIKWAIPVNSPAQARARLALFDSGVVPLPCFSDLFYECDGPPRAYFEIPLPAKLKIEDALPPFFLRGVYESIEIQAEEETLAREKLRELMVLACGFIPGTSDSDINPLREIRERFLIWRRRPVWEPAPRRNSRPGALFCRCWISGWTFASLIPENDAGRYVWQV